MRIASAMLLDIHGVPNTQPCAHAHPHHVSCPPPPSSRDLLCIQDEGSVGVPLHAVHGLSSPGFIQNLDVLVVQLQPHLFPVDINVHVLHPLVEQHLNTIRGNMRVAGQRVGGWAVTTSGDTRLVSRQTKPRDTNGISGGICLCAQ